MVTPIPGVGARKEGLKLTVGIAEMETLIKDAVDAYEEMGNDMAVLVQMTTSGDNPTKIANYLMCHLPGYSLYWFSGAQRCFLENVSREARSSATKADYPSLDYMSIERMVTTDLRRASPLVEQLGESGENGIAASFLGHLAPLSAGEYRTVIQRAARIAPNLGSSVLVIPLPGPSSTGTPGVMANLLIDEAIKLFLQPQLRVQDPERYGWLVEGSLSEIEPALDEIKIVGPAGTMLAGPYNQTTLYRLAQRISEHAPITDLNGDEIPKLGSWIKEEKHRIRLERKGFRSIDDAEARLIANHAIAEIQKTQPSGFKFTDARLRELTDELPRIIKGLLNPALFSESSGAGIPRNLSKAGFERVVDALGIREAIARPSGPGSQTDRDNEEERKEKKDRDVKKTPGAKI